MALYVTVTRFDINKCMYLTDTKHERNTLMQDVYPKLKDFCKSVGYQFQVCLHGLFFHVTTEFIIHVTNNNLGSGHEVGYQR